jgi:ABC-2 type transport system ATP-binding protein
VIELINITKKFENFTAVDSLNLTIKSGEIFGFLGPNGAGKTTTVKMIAGIMYPDNGEIKVNGIDVSKSHILAKKKIAYIPDEPFVYPNLTAYEFLKFIGDIYSIEKDKQINSISYLLEYFDLKDYANELLSSYSHGMKQKLLIASSLLREPEIILFDEPTVGLDPKSVKKFKEIIQSQTKKGVSIFMCTHILDMAEKLCDRVGIIYKGKLIACGDMSQLKKTTDKNSNLEEIFLNLTSL